VQAGTVSTVGFCGQQAIHARIIAKKPGRETMFLKSNFPVRAPMKR